MDVLGCRGLRGRCRHALLHSFVQGSWRACGFKYQQFWWGLGRRGQQALGPGAASAYPEDTGQVATRPPLEDSGSSAASARWAQSRSGHAGACPSLGLAT